jgi:peptide deformylase
MSYNLRLYPDSVLREKALPVDNVDGDISKLIDGMAEIMYSYQGIGLAAPQVGILKRVIIADIGDGLLSIANPNPEILQKEDEDKLEEGCLSLPDIQVEIERKKKISVKGISQEGKEITLELNGLMARVIQHEIDHLNGILIIDYVPLAEKFLLHKKLTKLKKGHKI